MNTNHAALMSCIYAATTSGGTARRVIVSKMALWVTLPQVHTKSTSAIYGGRSHSAAFSVTVRRT